MNSNSADQWRLLHHNSFDRYGLQMNIPDIRQTLSKVEAAQRQIEAAIDAMQKGDFDIAVTLAGAAEGIFSHRKGSDLFSRMIEYPQAAEFFTKTEWNAVINAERDWLKHPTLERDEPREFGPSDAGFMVARAMSKLRPDEWTPVMAEFKSWLTAHVRDEAENSSSG